MSKIAQIREAVSELSPPDRADLAAYILDGLDDLSYDVSDEEVLKRRDELNSGTVKGLTYAEFKAACGR